MVWFALSKNRQSAMPRGHNDTQGAPYPSDPLFETVSWATAYGSMQRSTRSVKAASEHLESLVLLLLLLVASVLL